jgi:hypothetical protein
MKQSLTNSRIKNPEPISCLLWPNVEGREPGSGNLTGRVLQKWHKENLNATLTWLSAPSPPLQRLVAFPEPAQVSRRLPVAPEKCIKPPIRFPAWPSVATLRLIPPAGTVCIPAPLIGFVVESLLELLCLPLLFLVFLLQLFMQRRIVDPTRVPAASV